MPILGTLGFTFVHKTGVHEVDFIVKRGGGNQSKASHKKLYDDRDAIYVENNYPELSNAGKRMCQKELLLRLSDTGGRMLKQVDDDVNWYYVVPENEALKIISVKFRPSLKRKPILDERIRQRMERIRQRTTQQVYLPVQLLSEEPNLNNVTTVDEANDAVTGQYDDNEEDTVVEGGLDEGKAFMEAVGVTHEDRGEASEHLQQHIASLSFHEFFGEGAKIDEEIASLFDIPPSAL